MMLWVNWNASEPVFWWRLMGKWKYPDCETVSWNTDWQVTLDIHIYKAWLGPCSEISLESLHCVTLLWKHAVRNVSWCVCVWPTHCVAHCLQINFTVEQGTGPNTGVSGVRLEQECWSLARGHSWLWSAPLSPHIHYKHLQHMLRWCAIRRQFSWCGWQYSFYNTSDNSRILLTNRVY